MRFDQNDRVSDHVVDLRIAGHAPNNTEMLTGQVGTGAHAMEQPPAQKAEAEPLCQKFHMCLPDDQTMLSNIQKQRAAYEKQFSSRPSWLPHISF